MMRHLLFVLGSAVLLTAVVGCGARKPVVTGVVTLDGQPLDHGDMQFFPAAGDGQTSFAFIGKDGRYRAEVSPTRTKVVIHLSRVVKQVKEYEGVPDSPMLEIREEVLPARYSDLNKTELFIDPKPGENTVDVQLNSDHRK